MIARVAVDNADLAWQFALDHLKEVTDKLDTLQHDSFVPSLGALPQIPVVYRSFAASLTTKFRRELESRSKGIMRI